MRLQYKGKYLKKRLVLDMLVEDLENKAVDEHHAVFEAKLLTYLRLTRKRLGLVINFGEERVKDGVHRVVNKL